MLRDDVLLLLTEAEGYVSGEEMREKLGVPLAAVSQAVRALRAAGYDIDAVTNRGYCLRARPDTLTAGDVLPYLPQARRALVQCFAQIDSTNSYLKAEAMSGAPDGLCAIADRQTAGRGRAGRSFRSDAGQGVYLSMLLRPACAATAGDTSRNGTHWQRLTMVGNITSAEVPSKINITPSGGSSSVLSSALAVLARSCSARSMM